MPELSAESTTARVGRIRLYPDNRDAHTRPLKRAVLGQPLRAEVEVEVPFSQICSAYTELVEARVADGPWVHLSSKSRGDGWCAVGAPTHIVFEEDVRKPLPGVFPTRALTLPYDQDLPEFRFATELLPQLRAGLNTLELRASTHCWSGQGPVPVALGSIVLNVESETSLHNYRQIIGPRVHKGQHPQAHKLATIFDDEFRAHSLASPTTFRRAVLASDVWSPTPRDKSRGPSRSFEQSVTFVVLTGEDGQCAARTWALVERGWRRTPMFWSAQPLSSPVHVPC